MWGETKRMFFNKNFLAAWLIACISIAIGQTYPSLKKALTCGTFISILEVSPLKIHFYILAERNHSMAIRLLPEWQKILPGFLENLPVY